MIITSFLAAQSRLHFPERPLACHIERRSRQWLASLAIALLLSAEAAAAQPPVFDLHVHLRAGEVSLQAYLDDAEKAQLEVAGLGAMWFGGPNQALAGRPGQVRATNDAILDLASKHPEVVPIATVHPYDGADAVAELERVAAKGIKLLKLHPHTQKFDPDDPRVLTLVKRAGELGVIALFDNAHILPGDSEKLLNLAIKVHGTKFIFAHMGALNFRFWNILKLARTAEGVVGDNIYFDISGLVVLVADSPIEEEFVWTMRNVGIDHILLGSDYPQISLQDTVNALDRLGLDETEQANVRYENARALLSPP
jgi:predicted TIM-barrel fold metal-dependent hydrolase